jgi:thiol-disulfide isomerase/thioredoxin
MRYVHPERPLALVLGLALACACESSSPGTSAPRPAPAKASRVTTPPRFIPAPSELDAVEPFIQEQLELSSSTGARTLVYVGAPWCEPCQRFHAAVLQGELDTVLAGTRLLEFDADHHDPALHRAGYAYQFIPVLAIPGADGRSSGRLLSGSIKGPAAVAGDLVPRLRALLDGRDVE